MSNSSTVSMYDSGTDNVAGALVGVAVASVAVCAVAAVAAARWLMETDAADRAALAAHKATVRRERIAGGQRLASPALPVRLHLRDPGALAASAERLGYVRVPLAGISGVAPILLSRASGERLIIEPLASGKVSVRTTAGRAAVTSLVREHVVSRAAAHLGVKGYRVAQERLGNGDTRLVAEAAGISATQGRILARVAPDGLTDVDIDCVSGPACEPIVAELAQAIGGEVVSSTRKAAYFQHPGEPTRIRGRV